MKQWKRVEPTTTTKIGRRTIVHKTFSMPDGRTEIFDTKEREDYGGVATVALTKDNKVLIYRQFRPGPERDMDELPGGMLDINGISHDADKLDIAQVEARALAELQEETGYTGKIRYLGRMSYDAYTNGWRYAFLAEDCVPTGKGQDLEPNELGGTLQQISVEQLLRNALDGRMTDSGAVLLAAAAKGWRLPPL